jgi:hypothetical protein
VPSLFWLHGSTGADNDFCHSSNVSLFTPPSHSASSHYRHRPRQSELFSTRSSGKLRIVVRFLVKRKWLTEPWGNFSSPVRATHADEAGRTGHKDRARGGSAQRMFTIVVRFLLSNSQSSAFSLRARRVGGSQINASVRGWQGKFPLTKPMGRRKRPRSATAQESLAAVLARQRSGQESRGWPYDLRSTQS